MGCGRSRRTKERIERSLALNPRAAENHFSTLREFGYIKARPVGARTRFFKNGGAYNDAEKRAHVALAPSKARLVLAALLKRPASRLAELAVATGLPKTTVRWHLDRFEAFGLLRDGREPAPELVDVLARPA